MQDAVVVITGASSGVGRACAREFTRRGARIGLIARARDGLNAARRIRAGVERLQGLWDYFVQTTHPGNIQLEGDTAVGRAYISELVRFHDGRSQQNHAVYHDRYQRTPDGWKFTERVYEVRYLDATPLAGSAPASGRSPGADRES